LRIFSPDPSAMRLRLAAMFAYRPGLEAFTLPTPYPRFIGALEGFPAALADFLAVLMAMATACFCGLPAFISLEMFSLMDFLP